MDTLTALLPAGWYYHTENLHKKHYVPVTEDASSPMQIYTFDTTRDQRSFTRQTHHLTLPEGEMIRQLERFSLKTTRLERDKDLLYFQYYAGHCDFQCFWIFPKHKTLYWSDQKIQFHLMDNTCVIGKQELQLTFFGENEGFERVEVQCLQSTLLPPHPENCRCPAQTILYPWPMRVPSDETEILAYVPNTVIPDRVLCLFPPFNGMLKVSKMKNSCYSKSFM